MSRAATWLSKDWTNFVSLGIEILGAIFAAAAGVRLWMRMRRAVSWPSTQGTIQWAEARVVAGRGERWVGEFSYSYSVDGHYYSGFQIIRSRNERRAEELVAGWKGRMVVVRYDPRQNDVSVLLKEDQPGGQLGN